MDIDRTQNHDCWWTNREFSGYLKMVKSKLERAKSLVEKKVQALDDLETLISEVDKKDLNQFFSTVSF